MDIGLMKPSDWDVFLALAEREGWRVPEQELDLFGGILSSCAFALKAWGKSLGFVTAVAYEKNGWIGNLLVHPRWRGKGYGSRLFDHALAELARQGVETIWLTASALGRPLYEKKGFRRVDGVVRWQRELEEEAGKPKGEAMARDALFQADARVWGESRRELVGHLAEGGDVHCVGETVALLQKRSNLRVLGPWVSPNLCPRENRLVLAGILGAAGEGDQIVADVLESSPLGSLLMAADFSVRGRCDLMAKGPGAGVDLKAAVALASLGSIG